MTPPIDIFAVACERLRAAQEALRVVEMLQSSASAFDTYQQALLSGQQAYQDMRAVNDLILALSR